MGTSLNDFRANTMDYTLNMLNLLQLAHDAYDTDAERQKAYSKVAVALDLSPDSFSDLI